MKSKSVFQHITVLCVFIPQFLSGYVYMILRPDASELKGKYISACLNCPRLTPCLLEMLLYVVILLVVASSADFV